MGRGQTTVTWLRTLSQSSAMLANVSEVHFFFSPVFFFVSSILSSSLLPLSFLSSSFPSSSSALSVIVRAKILSISFAEVSKLRSAAYVNNGWRRTELSGTSSLCFLDLARSPAAAQRSTSAIGRWILSTAMAKSISASIEKVEDELSDPARASAITDYTRYIFQRTHEQTSVVLCLAWHSWWIWKEWGNLPTTISNYCCLPCFHTWNIELNGDVCCKLRSARDGV